ncbi:unnamed protein product [Brassica oleracea]
MSKPTAALVFLIAAFSYFLFSPSPKPHYYHTLFLSSPFSDNASIASNLRTLTRRPHVAGSLANAEAASHVLSSFASSSLKPRVAAYKVSLTYPVHRSLSLTPTESSKSIITFSLEQEHLGDNPYADEVTPTFHAYAKSGDVSGPAAYANYGRVEDFAGLNVSGAVVVARYGKIYRGDIVRNAYEAGAVGVVIYTDERDYGGEECFPESRWMPPSGVQVGTVYNGLGDPTTPGWASVDGCERLSEEEVELRGDSPGIPSLPISAADAEVILKTVVGGVGPGPGILNLSYVGKTVLAEIENVIGVIEGGEEPDRYVILGNHRDAWTFGAVDPNSGTAVLLEIAQRLDKLQKRGWKPRRTIILCNWDAEEYALIGSTEWVEDNRQMLASRAVAYLNADCAVSGPGFRASATPQLDDLIKQVAKEVRDPDNTTQSIYESWIRSNNSGVIGRLGSGASDYASFVQHVGVPAVDMLFGGGYPVYHSMYDDFTWMEKFGDPMFHRHVAIASVLGLVALRLADDEFLPFNYTSYASELKKSAEDLEKEMLGHSIDISPLIKSIQDLSTAAQEINIEKEEGVKGALRVRELNDRLMMAERALTDRDGLSGRTWYKHLVYGPSKYDDYGSKSFPGVDDAIDNAKRVKTKASWEHVQHEMWRVSRAIRHASLVLKAEVHVISPSTTVTVQLKSFRPDETTMLSGTTFTRRTPFTFSSLHNRKILTGDGSSRALSFGYKHGSLNSARINWSGRSGPGFGHLGRVSSVSGGGSGGSGGIGGSGGDSSGGGGEDSGGNGNKWSFLSWYLALLSDYPVLTKSVTSALLTLIGDLICQLTINKTSSLDKKRTLTFTILGFGLVGPALHFWYLYLSKVVTASGLSGAVLRLLLDQFVFAPVFVGVFLSAVVTLEGKPSNVIPKLKQEWTGAVVANWQLWIPFQFLNFRFVPQNFQVLASNVVALAWNVILSFKAHKEVVPK